jgi:hypothetical protein
VESKSKTAEIELVQHVRHEIAHHYPRPVGPSHVPEWLQPLADKGLFHSVGIAPQDIGWQQKLQSFQLARWCAAATCQTAQEFSNAICSNSENVFVATYTQIGAAYFRALLV